MQVVGHPGNRTGYRGVAVAGRWVGWLLRIEANSTVLQPRVRKRAARLREDDTTDGQGPGAPEPLAG
jgi:hypothetical protein